LAAASARPVNRKVSASTKYPAPAALPDSGFALPRARPSLDTNHTLTAPLIMKSARTIDQLGLLAPLMFQRSWSAPRSTPEAGNQDINMSSTQFEQPVAAAS